MDNRDKYIYGKYLNISNMKLLELFSGTCSVGNVAIKYGYSVTSLDLKNADML